MEYNLLEKTELWVTGLKLNEVNLTEMASATAEVLELSPSEVKVVDVHDNLVTLDILRRTVKAEDIAGKEEALLTRLATLPGIDVTPEAAVHSDGVLGMIAMDPAEAPAVLERTRTMTEVILASVARRAIVYSSGFEVSRGLIEDTNGPYIRTTLAEQGFNVTIGPILEDDKFAIARAFNEAVNRGFGLAISTGGVGAESKDRSVEGLLEIDPEAVTPWLVKYQQGQGRHEKEGVRIAVGQVGLTTMIALPGPHDEVQTAMPIICQHLEQSAVDKHQLAHDIASALRSVLAEKMKHWDHSNGHHNHKHHSQKGEHNGNHQPGQSG
jgi:molybdenum cofactor synthesis domain-containing protein